MEYNVADGPVSTRSVRLDLIGRNHSMDAYRKA